MYGTTTVRYKSFREGTDIPFKAQVQIFYIIFTNNLRFARGLEWG
jgi:hypothetical protein